MNTFNADNADIVLKAIMNHGATALEAKEMAEWLEREEKRALAYKYQRRADLQASRGCERWRAHWQAKADAEYALNPQERMNWRTWHLMRLAQDS